MHMRNHKASGFNGRIGSVATCVSIALALLLPTGSANAAAGPVPPAVPSLPGDGGSLSAVKKRCTKKQRKRLKRCKPRYVPTTPTVQSRHWIRDVDGNGTLEVTFDTDGDGTYESVFFDTQQDGYYDVFFTSGVNGTAGAIDSNADTYYEYIYLDPASDGWWDLAYYDSNADRLFDWVGYDINPTDNTMDSWYVLQQPVTSSVSPLVTENIVTMDLIRTQDPWAQQDPWGTWSGGASENPLY